MSNIKTTSEYFGLSHEELLQTKDHSYTKEENLLYDEGLNVTFFDDLKECEQEKETFQNWINERNFEVKTVLETINGRIAFVLI
ncbi:hypothetical protein [uncultured Metabacillus sp.]|uniref:hypothetical protein n=1 Tax=uncultured Metabacillus sp. TaxID=2860135 RepID=UPI0026200AD6|nr:hypothetical protein [uncultured Metabacillus sp.]